jgi:tetratricopeptide (TPR) repeat protein
LGYVAGKLDDTAEIDPQKDDPKELIDYHRMSRQYTISLENKNFDQAKIICARMLSKYKNLTQTYYLWGYAAFEQGQIDEAAEKFTQYVHSNPDDAKGQYRLGLALARLNRHEQAAEHFRKAIHITPDDYMLYGNLALSLNQLGKYDDAVKQFGHLLRLRPDDPDAYANIAVALALQNKLDQAVHHYKQALRLRPDDPGVHINIGKAFAQQNNLDEALRHWNTALNLTAPQSAVHRSLRNLMAEQLARHDRIPQAIEQFNELLRITPGNYQFHYNLGLLYHRQNKFEKTISHWDRVLKLKPDHLQTLNSLAWILATNSQPKYRDPQQAVELAQKACKFTDFNDPTHLDTLAAAYAADGKFDKAVETAKKALELAAAQNRKKMAEQIKNRLALYKKDNPYLETHK